LHRKENILGWIGGEEDMRRVARIRDGGEFKALVESLECH
jgi:hypothetical protein